MFDTFAFDLFIIALFALGIYAFLIAPRQREFRKRQKLVTSLEPGTSVLTYGGVIGTLKEVDNETGIVRLEIAEGIEIKLVAAAITDEFDANAYAESAQKILK